MPIQATILRVFIASPGDVIEERTILEQVIQEINKIWGKSFPIRLELISWETDTHPDISTDPQAVINEQIGNNYEIFIGILWTRLGTPTGRAPSGTIEEFQRAYNRLNSDPDSVKVMFYFKTTPVPPDSIAPDQIAQIQEFRNLLGEKGLYTEFSTVEEFESYSRQHLSMLVQEWGNKWGVGEIEVTKKDVELTPEEEPAIPELDYLEEEEEGFLDLIDGGIDDFEKSSRISQIMSNATEELGKKLDSRTAELTREQESGDPSVAFYKKISNKAASDLMEYVVRMRNEIPLFSDSLFRALDRYGKAIVLLTDFELNDTSQIDLAISSIVELRSSIESALKGIESLRESIAKSPRLTSKFNRAKREAVNLLDQLINEYHRAINISQEIEETMIEVHSKIENM